MLRRGRFTLQNIVVKMFFFACILTAPFAVKSQRASQALLPIVPGLAGFGVATTAGSGRHASPAISKIFRVTNLNANGSGSLQECIYAAGARTCVFEISGTIDLTGDKSYDGSAVINLKNPFITIAGQTAPSPGITVKGKTLRIEAHDVLIQHLRFRVGDSVDVAIAPDVRDTILIAGNNRYRERTPHNVVIDHCSISWAIDEVVSVKDSSHHITLSNNIISEGLDRSLHSKGRHSKGLMAVGNYQTIYRNLFANLRDRAPLDVGPNSVLVNNLSHNSKYAGFWPLARSKHYLGSGNVRQTVVVGNVRIRGNDTSDRRQNIYGKVSEKISTGARFYLRDNLCMSEEQRLVACTLKSVEPFLVTTPPIGNDGMNIWPALEVKNRLLTTVGARPADRDSIDQRIVREVETNTGKVPNCVGDTAIFYPIGSLQSATLSSVMFELGQCYSSRFENQVIEIIAGAGNGQKRTIRRHECSPFDKAELVVDRPWVTPLDTSSRYRIINGCSNNAGGWQRLAEHSRRLTLPAKPNQIRPSGYTRLEEYLHTMARRVELRD